MEEQQQPPPATPPPPSPGEQSLDPRLAGLLAYLIPPITGIIFLLVERSNAVVRWHAAQSTAFGIAWIVLWIGLVIVSTILGTVVPILGTIVGFMITLVVWLGGLAIWVVCLVKGYSGTKWRMPGIAPYAEKVLGMSEGAAPAE